MAQSGYSGTPLAQKLGIAAGHRVALLGAPEGFDATLGPLPEVSLIDRPRDGCDVVVMFCRGFAELAEHIAAAEAALTVAGGLWVAWPKRASKVPTDLTEDRVRELALPRGLVDNKVCAIDETWSGLRLVWRKERRLAIAAARGGAPPPAPRSSKRAAGQPAKRAKRGQTGRSSAGRGAAAGKAPPGPRRRTGGPSG